MIMKANKQIGFIYKNNESIDKILKDGDVVFERGFLREKTSTTLPITFGGVGKNLKDYKIYGNTYQNSTSGKNLCGVPNLNTTISGVEINIKDGIITLNGTATGAIFYYINPINTTILNGGYTLNNIYVSGDVSSTGTKNFNIRRADDQSNIFSNGFVQSNSYKYNNFSENVEIIFGIYCANGTVFNNYKFMPQLVAGTESDYDYESYTGGQPSPNPDYPQEIISCGDRTKNLATNFDTGWYTTNTGTFTSNTNFRKCIAKIEPNTTYTISKKNASNRFVVITSETEIEPAVSYKRIVLIEQNTNTTQYTFTTEANENYLFFGYYSGTNETEIELAEEEIMIEKSPSATSYEPYGYKIPVNVRGKNLLDDKNITARIRCTVDNGVITTLTLKKADTFYININDIPLKAGDELYTTFKIRLKSGTASKIQYGGRLYNGTTYATNTGVTPATVSNEFVTYSIKQTTSTDIIANQMVFQAENTETASNMVYEIKDIIVSVNPIDTYEAYYNETTNIYLDEPLRKIDGYSDYIDFINGKVVRNINEIVVDGTRTSGVLFNTSTNTSRIQYTSNPRGRHDDINIFCNQLKGVTNYNNDIEGIYVNYASFVLRISKDKIGTSITSANEYFAINPLILDYILETPTEESITLPNIPTVDGNNTLNIETEITPSQVYIKYKSNT